MRRKGVSGSCGKKGSKTVTRDQASIPSSFTTCTAPVTLLAISNGKLVPADQSTANVTPCICITACCSPTHHNLARYVGNSIVTAAQNTCSIIALCVQTVRCQRIALDRISPAGQCCGIDRNHSMRCNAHVSGLQCADMLVPCEAALPVAGQLYTCHMQHACCGVTVYYQ